MSAAGMLLALALGWSAPNVETGRMAARHESDSSQATMVRRAQRAFDARQWDRAAELWREALLTEGGGAPAHWVSLADALYRAARYREAVAAYQRAVQQGAMAPADGAWHVARSYARLGNDKQATRWLEQAQRLGAPRNRPLSSELPLRSSRAT